MSLKESADAVRVDMGNQPQGRRNDDADRLHAFTLASFPHHPEVYHGSGLKQAARLELSGISTPASLHGDHLPLHSGPAQQPANIAPPAKANPAPLGLLAFGMTTCMLMVSTTRWDASGHFSKPVMGYALFHGGFVQLLAGMWEMAQGNTFAATAFSSYGAFWMGWFINNLLVTLAHVPPSSEYKSGEALWLASWAMLTLMFFVMTLRKSRCLQTIFGLLVVTFVLLAGGVYSDSVHKAAGYIGMACGLSAIYTAFAELLEETWHYKLPGL